MKLEIASHCWHYAPQFTYQLGSLVLFSPRLADLSMTVWYCPEDSATQAVVKYFANQKVPGITWLFLRLPSEQLFSLDPDQTV